MPRVGQHDIDEFFEQYARLGVISTCLSYHYLISVLFISVQVTLCRSKNISMFNSKCMCDSTLGIEGFCFVVRKYISSHGSFGIMYASLCWTRL